MIKMIMNDLNYSIDEGWDKLKKINEIEKKGMPQNPQERIQ